MSRGKAASPPVDLNFEDDNSITTAEAVDEVATEKPPDSIDAEVTEASGVDVVAAKLLANEEEPTEKETEKEAEKEAATIATNPSIDDQSKAPEFVRLVVEPPSQLNEMSPPPPQKLRLTSSS